MTVSFTSFRPFSIFTAIAIQALYCKHRRERKGNKKAEPAIASSTSMHRREPRSWGRQRSSNSSGYLIQTTFHKHATKLGLLKPGWNKIKRFAVIYNTVCLCSIPCNFCMNNAHLPHCWSKIQQTSLCSEDEFICKHGKWEEGSVIFLFETYLLGMVRKRKEEEKIAISAMRLNEPDLWYFNTWHCPSGQKKSPNTYAHIEM